jgi:hypothetical protein
MNSNTKNLVLEIERIELIRKRCRLFSGFCKTCSKDTDFVSLTQMSSLFEIRAEDFFQTIRVSPIHFETELHNEIFLCINSLLNFLNTTKSNTKIKMIKGKIKK